MYNDSNGIELKVGDTIQLEIVGLGVGECEIKNNDKGDICIYNESNGYYRLDLAIIRTDMIITKI